MSHGKDSNMYTFHGSTDEINYKFKLRTLKLSKNDSVEWSDGVLHRSQDSLHLGVHL